MSLSLADRSVKYPRGIIDNLLVKVDKFVFPIDFVVLDMEADEKVTIIIGRPFLRTAKALINVYDGKITLRVGIDSCFDYICGADLVGRNGLVDCDDLGEDESCENDSVCDELVEISEMRMLHISCESEAGSLEKPIPLELKVLSSNLEYAYLDEGSNFPVIVSSKLTEKEKSKLTDVLKLHKGVIAWRLSDIQVISPDYYTHRILMEDEYKPVMQPQRRLNPNMQEVVKKENYTTTKKELLAVVFAFDKFRSYLVLSKTTIFTDHAALRFLFQMKDTKPRLIRWILLLFEFDIEIKDKNGAENIAVDHLSRLEDLRREDLREEEIGDRFPHESIDFVANEKQGMPWFTDFANYLAKNIVLEGMTTQQKRKFFRDVNRYVWDDPFLFKIGGDRILIRCVTKEEGWDILKHVYEGLTGGHHGAHAIAQKVFDSGFYWPTVVKDAEEFVKLCDACQRTGNISSKNKMPQNPIQILENFDVWGIDFMGPFPT
ncbi:uncharacterized protein LOC143571310 [Bidens hawaiensis]|uniref:uncharacterized protein LOC143571310 n=1 Tax=Bidens hawaiensis TaxID=980011 RepID=UPI00404A95E9